MATKKISAKRGRSPDGIMIKRRAPHGRKRGAVKEAYLWPARIPRPVPRPIL